MVPLVLLLIFSVAAGNQGLNLLVFLLLILLVVHLDGGGGNFAWPILSDW